MSEALLRDQWGRSIEYLRISVTDRCNFRCVYCMPLEGLQWLPKADILSYEEIAEVVRQLAPLGLRRLRLTGGEPTIRPDLEPLSRCCARFRASRTSRSPPTACGCRRWRRRCATPDSIA